MPPVSESSPARPRLLVSVRNADEAALVCASGADLVDAKDPDSGALGALPVAVVRAIVSRVGARVTTSAVAGEPDGDAALAVCVAAMAETGVDFVKVAVRPEQSDAALAAAAEAASGRLIGVLFAEDGVALDILPRLAAVGFCGAMIDTRGKTGRRLGDWLSADRLAAFVTACQTHGLLSGLAGSLRIEDVPALAAHEPGYLGFRGGLCRDGDRHDALEPVRVSAAVEALRTLGRRDAA
ncbi:MAG: (5-formylfuran-3-yl)methyl phosphate synthase [Methylobacterium sp.]